MLTIRKCTKWVEPGMEILYEGAVVVRGNVIKLKLKLNWV